MKSISLAIIFLLSLYSPQVCFARDLSEPFYAVCRDVAIHEYNFRVGMNAEILERGWSSDAKLIGGGLKFHWTPPDKLVLNGDELTIVAKRATSISAMITGGIAANVHTYVINVPLKSAVYSRVAASDMLGHDISIRAIELACDFTFE